MKTKTIALVIFAGFGLLYSPFPLQACGGGIVASLSTLTRQAVDADASVADRAINALRQQGPAGLDALLEAHAALIRQHATNSISRGAVNDEESWERLRTALDKVSGQRDDYASRLYWYTDFDQAEAAAKASGKPILSLRLLGRLDEEYSCANSRFFRTTLYANGEIAAYLRQHFILHWQSVRPVPRITIDFGDGRKIEQTITGNSIHYVLAPDGQVIDALPGLYGPKAFLKGLTAAEKAAVQYVALDQGQRSNFLITFHRESLATLLANWKNDLAKSSDRQSLVEISGKPMDSDRLPQIISVDDVIWSRVATFHAEDGQFDENSLKLIENKNPPARLAGTRAVSKGLVENPLLKQIRNLQRSISVDTVRNEYQLHSTIHQWLASGQVPGGLARLNERIYAELFLTPDSDPWLGLAPTDTFTGLENAGLVWKAQ